jgi:hypothetical protein
MAGASGRPGLYSAPVLCFAKSRGGRAGVGDGKQGPRVLLPAMS